MGLKNYYNLAEKKLFEINRSITGNGTVKTLKIIKKNFKDLKIKKIKSGTKVFDWKIPPEWNVENAYIVDKDKKKIIDFKNNNLHLVGYSNFINKKIKKDELLKHLNSIPSKPKAIPYVTSYYKKYWGFCISEEQKKEIKKNYKKSDFFKVLIDSKFKKNGFMNYGELFLPGKSKQEILISTYICHPSMANNELSGPIVSMGLINFFRKTKNEKSLRFIFIPETIGSIAFLSQNFSKLKKNVIGGYNLSCIGDNRMHSCILSKYNSSPSDYALLEAYKDLRINYKRFSFLKRGSDERQFNSPGIDIPITSIFRSKYGEYKEYHTSLDNFKIVSFKGIKGGYSVALKAIQILDKKIIPKSKITCEPFLFKRNLKIANIQLKDFKSTILHFLQYSDGKNDLKKISNLIGLDFIKTKKIYNFLIKNNLLEY
tara:strand:- start:15700 stop:16983 length:1284 start_codon:yes stop_codon:yes gene_type:complete